MSLPDPLSLLGVLAFQGARLSGALQTPKPTPKGGQQLCRPHFGPNAGDPGFRQGDSHTPPPTAQGGAGRSEAATPPQGSGWVEWLELCMRGVVVRARGVQSSRCRTMAEAPITGCIEAARLHAPIPGQHTGRPVTLRAQSALITAPAHASARVGNAPAPSGRDGAGPGSASRKCNWK